MAYSSVTVLFLSLALLLVAPAITQATLCNGHESLCERRYDQVTYLITHDSYAYGNNVAATQSEPIIQQLNRGVRGLKFSAVLPDISITNKNDPRSLHLCHTSCSILDAGSAVDTLNQIGAWLKENPGEVVSIFWNNLYNLDIGHLAAAYEASTVVPYIYTHGNNNQQQWPSLQEMIESGKRLVNFVDAGADTSKTPWLMDEFSLVFETPYDNTNINAFNCSIDRPRDPPSADTMMYVVNHFLYGVIELGFQIKVPQRDKAGETNGNSLKKHVDECSETFKRKPNYIEVDFYERGSALEYVAQLNGVQPLPSSTSSSPKKAIIDEKSAVDAANYELNRLRSLGEHQK
ncbi:PLC-like phosphodiesterase [Zychaea mexicana]|uniref:PLC-like phosphodiesterase n=1 Tax=Zychaea mexicana TaxID=64656 RepID=UPI0022FEE112|nr:PLC-like phosphodiesterase [Zychaea mexicana]KAI9488818.1 PLC-like phosphodiesterase [Zychaea mexicana]